MPQTITPREGMSSDEIGILNMLLTQLEAKERRNYLRASFYDGKRAAKQISNILPPQYYKLGMVLGWSAKAVDILARRTKLDAMVWADGNLDDLGIRELWDGNELGTEIAGGITTSLIHATSFLITTTGDESVGEPAALIHAKSARNATGDWDGRRRALTSALSVLDRATEGERRGQVTAFALYFYGLTITGRCIDGQWFIERSEHPWGMPVEAMTYKRRPDRPFGSSRISRTVMAIGDSAVRTVLRMEGHADVYSHPEMVMLGADPSMFLDETGNPMPSWRMMLGRWKGIPDDEDAVSDALARADVKQFPSSSPEPHIAQLKQQAMLFSGETSIPLTSLGVSDQSNPTSADSFIASREDLISEAEGATDDWAPAVRRTVARALAIQNGLNEIPAEWASIDAKWCSPVHISRAAEADAGMKAISAVPDLADSEVGLELLGMNAQQITRHLAERRRREGSDTLRALREAGGTAAPAVDPEERQAQILKAKFEALGIAARAGINPEDAARLLGLDDVTFIGVPTTVRPRADEAGDLEDK